MIVVYVYVYEPICVVCLIAVVNCLLDEFAICLTVVAGLY